VRIMQDMFREVGDTDDFESSNFVLAFP